MKTKKFRLSLLLGAMLVIASSLFFTTKAHAFREAGNTRLLIPCSIQLNGHIILLGNSCINGGNGCIPNPCGD